MIDTPVLNNARVAHLTGLVVSLEPREHGMRLVLDEVRSGALQPAPRRVRVALGAGGSLRPGEWLSMRARLDTQPAIREPGASDLGRALFFQSIGAVGFAYGRAHLIVPARPPTMVQRLRQEVEDMRLTMTRRIQVALPASIGGIASALITGERGGITQEDEEALRDAGLAHVLAIAGLHMALMGGGIFWLLRAGLVAVAEWERQRERTAPRGAFYRYARGIVMTSLVGSLATLPFAMFHFDRATHYAVLGNLIAMPVMGFWVMPAAALSVALMPLGLEGFALHLLGQGIGVMLAMGRWVSGLPGAVSLAPAMPLSALLMISLGGLWLTIWRRAWRWLGLAPLVLGWVLAWAAPVPDMLVASDATTIAIRGADGLLHFVRKPKDRFIARDWLRRDGDGRDIADAVGLPGLKCDGLGCVVKRKPLIAASFRSEALAEDCVRAQILVSSAAASCKGPAVVIDPKAAAKGEGWRVTLSPTPTACGL